MRNQFFLLLCAFFLVAGLFSESNAQICFSYGLKAGINAGTPIGPADEGATGRPGIGPVLGAYAIQDITPKWGVQAELYYIQKKSEFSTPVTDQDYTYKLTNSKGEIVYLDTKFTGTITGEFDNKYLEMPIMGYYQISDNFNVTLGTYLGYLITPGNTGTATGIVGYGNLEVDNESFDEGENINKFDIGIAGGVRYEWKNRINLELKATTGLRSVYKPSYEIKPETVRNINLHLTAGYRIHSYCKKSKEEREMKNI